MNGIADVAGLANVIAQGGDDNVLTHLIDISFSPGIEPAPGPGETNFKTLLAAFRDAGGQGSGFQGDASSQECVAERVCAFLGGGSACLGPGEIDSDGDGVADRCGKILLACDINGDGDIDRSDIDLILAARNTLPDPGDPRDVDGDGKITVNDARICSLKCTKPNCAP